jgi:hypothetical protein
METVTAVEYARQHSVWPQTVYKWIELGKLEARRTPGSRDWAIPADQPPPMWQRKAKTPKRSRSGMATDAKLGEVVDLLLRIETLVLEVIEFEERAACTYVQNVHVLRQRLESSPLRARG